MVQKFFNGIIHGGLSEGRHFSFPARQTNLQTPHVRAHFRADVYGPSQDAYIRVFYHTARIYAM